MFRETGVECAVLEVGLGGRLDATNVVLPRVAVITSISWIELRFSVVYGVWVMGFRTRAPSMMNDTSFREPPRTVRLPFSLLMPGRVFSTSVSAANALASRGPP